MPNYSFIVHLLFHTISNFVENFDQSSEIIADLKLYKSGIRNVCRNKSITRYNRLSTISSIRLSLFILYIWSTEHGDFWPSVKGSHTNTRLSQKIVSFTLHYITLLHIYITLHYITLHYITLHYIALHYITLHHIASHRIASHRIKSNQITSHHITSHHITSHHITLHYITLHVMMSDVITSLLFRCNHILIGRIQKIQTIVASYSHGFSTLRQGVVYSP